MLDFERRWVHVILCSFAPEAGSALAPQGAEPDYVATFEGLHASARHIARVGFRLALWLVALAPGWLLRRGGTMARLPLPARRELLDTLTTLRHTAVLYESPARLSALLEDLVTACGAARPVAVARELTKLHESIVRGTLTEVLSYYQKGAVRGEVVVVLGGAPPPAPASEADAIRLARELLASGATPRSAAKELAQRLQISRNEAYSLVLSLGGDG